MHNVFSPLIFCPCKYPHGGTPCRPEDARTPCAKCGDIDCAAYFESVFMGPHSYRCAQRVIVKHEARIAELEARIAELEFDPGRFASCTDCGTELVTSAIQCARCSGVAPVE